MAAYKTLFFPEKLEGEPINYRAAVAGGLKLVADGSTLEVLEDDYRAMVDAGQLLDDVEAFLELVARCRDIEARANAAALKGVGGTLFPESVASDDHGLGYAQARISVGRGRQ